MQHYLYLYIYNSFVRSSLSAIHRCTNFVSRGLKPTLNGFGSVVSAVGIALHSIASKIGRSAGSLAGCIVNAMISRTYAVYSSRLARCEPAHMREPAP